MAAHLSLWLKRILTLGALLFFVAGLVVMFDWLADRSTLSEIAERVAADKSSDGERIVALNQWVYRNQGFEKNRQYYLRGLGPTPIQVLEAGGDCADKSRLLSALLRELSIPSTLAMLYSCQDCDPNHTIVEAQYEKGWMALDPVYDLHFPQSDGSYSSIEELASDNALLESRLAVLVEQRGPEDKITRYHDDQAIYTFARTVNWDKNGLTRFVGSVIEATGSKASMVRRPGFLEDPKYFVMLALFGAAASCLGFLALLMLWSKKTRTSAKV